MLKVADSVWFTGIKFEIHINSLKHTIDKEIICFGGDDGYFKDAICIHEAGDLYVIHDKSDKFSYVSIVSETVHIDDEYDYEVYTVKNAKSSNTYKKLCLLGADISDDTKLMTYEYRDTIDVLVYRYESEDKYRDNGCVLKYPHMVLEGSVPEYIKIKIDL